MIVLIMRNFKSTSWNTRLITNFAANLAPRAADMLDDDICIVSCDELSYGSDLDDYQGIQVHRVPSIMRIRSPETYTDRWSKGKQDSLTGTILQKNIDFVRVLTRTLKHIPETKIIHWFDMFTPLVNTLKFVTTPRIRTYATIFGLKLSYWSLDDLMINIFVGGLDRLVVTTSSLKNYLLQSAGIRGERILHIPVGLDLSSFEPVTSKASLKAAHGIDPQRKVIAWFGPISPSSYTDLACLVESISDLPANNAMPLFILAFKYGIPSDLLQPNQNARFLTGLESAAEVLGYADLVILPFSRRKTLVSHQPLTIMEALASGVPVATLNYPGVNELVIDGVNGILVERSEDLLDRAISLCNDENHLKKMSKNARGIAERHYDIDEVARKYVNLWTDLWDTKRKSRHQSVEG